MGHSRKVEAFTLTELIVVFVVAGIFLNSVFRQPKQASRISCINNLKELGTAYHIWSNDNGDRFPAATPITNGGWSDLLHRANASAYGWTNYVRMADEMGQSPRILVCPVDERKFATSFSNLANINISYFVGVGADDSHPQSLLGGDRNLGPGTTPDAEYGFSPADGRGNDVVVNGPVCWSLKMHSRGNPAGGGNILLGDGSAQQTTSGNLNANWMKNALAEKAPHDKTTNSPGMRLIFP
jgi:hypothetical protein